MKGGERDFRKLFLYSLLIHLLLVLVFTVFSSNEREESPRERVVRLLLKKRVVSKDIVPDRPQESASGQDQERSDQVFDASFFKKVRRQLLHDRSRVSDTGPEVPISSRDRGLDKRYDRLQKSPDKVHGRLNRSSSRKIDDYPGRRDLNKDIRTRDGDFNSLGRNRLARDSDNRNPLRDSGSLRSTQGNRGSSITGFLNVRGRRVVYSPRIVLPSRYSRQGLSYTVRVRVVLSPEGIVTSASVLGLPGDAELRRIIVQAARRYRVESIPGPNNDTGILVITIRPR